MALLADFGMKLFSKLNDLGFFALEDGNLVETVTIGAGCGVGISRCHRFAVDAVSITVVRMAGGTLLDHPDLVPFPRGHLMDLLVAVLALNLIDEMGTGIMLCPLFFVASMAGDRFRMDPSPFGREVALNIRNVPVASIA
jgi:hypothetical protein